MDNVYVRKTEIYKYNNNELFNPNDKYPEGLNISIDSDAKIYDEVRNLLIDMQLDKKNIGTNKWNPFKDFIKKNNRVVIKPNLVKHINENHRDGDIDSLITNFSIIRPIIDYTILALNNTGTIIVGDAPVQECDFEEVIKISNLKKAINIYKENGYNIELKDFRNNNGIKSKCTIVNLKNDSEFTDVDRFSKKYAITNYNLKDMHNHHNKECHEYFISNDILNADVIINLPKPKTHRKAGITACMKNFIGINGKKEYIPHHRNGCIKSGGDEYPENSIIKGLLSFVKNYSYTHNFCIIVLRGVLYRILKLMKKTKYLEGSWYGNDTIWRSILDINKIVLYANKKGKMEKEKQRVIFNLADMIISGEKEGPLIPSNKKVGLLVASFNQLNMDNTICKMMGFNAEKIKYIANGYRIKKYSIAKTKKYCNILMGEKDNLSKINMEFIASEGWYEYLNKDIIGEGKI